ncbi:hypothetical protein CRUP_016197 [Coryphaenoides rupestris]|nr:hypothetical protein CRUP_016197 [Coryphaenoides rupestris]
MWPNIGKQLGHPTSSLAGWLVSRFLRVGNRVLEEKAVRLCGIQPGDTVLEVGHGPGLGLQAAASLLTQPSGSLIGMASELLTDLVASGKVTLHHCDVAAMPLADDTVDKVFHCNCYYFWPDLSKGTAEIHRMASELLTDLVASGKVTLHHCDVAAMPLADDTVDKVFHCNCYYFWPDLSKGTAEIHRVMKPGGLMVTTLRLRSVAILASKGVMPGKNWRPEAYMEALRGSGFVDVRMEDVQHSKITFQAIYATAQK